MGAFFTNVQLKTSEINKSNITEKVVDWIVKRNVEEGFIKVENEDNADKSVIVSPSEDLSWISIYDEGTEGQDTRMLTKIASGLSKEFKTSALSILVNDSDTVYIGISENGVLKDKLSNRSKTIDFNKNNPSIWLNVLAKGYSLENVKTAWQKKSVFVESFLSQFAELVNLKPSKLLTGYDYLSEEKLTDDIKINFAQKDKKIAELGLTKFRMLAGVGVVNLKTGEKQTSEWIVTNLGSTSKGLDVIVAGECITNDLLIPEQVTVSLFRYKNPCSTKFIETLSTAGNKIFYAKIEDFIIPEGYQPKFPMNPKESKRYGIVQYERGMNFNITFAGSEKGTGEFTVYFSPLINRQEGGDYSTSMKGSLEDWQKKNGL